MRTLLSLSAVCLLAFVHPAYGGKLQDDIRRADAIARGTTRVRESVPTRAAAPAQPGKLVIQCPAGCDLWVDDVHSTQSGTERVFTTDPITECGTYTVKCRCCDGNSCKVITREVAVTPGGTTTIAVCGPVTTQASGSGCTCGPSCPAGGNCQMGECGVAGCRPAGFKAVLQPSATVGNCATCATCSPGVGYSYPTVQAGYGYPSLLGACAGGMCAPAMGYGWPVGYGGGDCSTGSCSTGSCGMGAGGGSCAGGSCGGGGGGGRGLFGRRR